MKSLLILSCCLCFAKLSFGQSTPLPDLQNPFIDIKSISSISHVDVEAFAPELPPKATITSSFQTAGNRFKLNFKSRTADGRLIADNTYGYDQDHYYLVTALDGVADLQKNPQMNKPVLFGGLGPLEAFEFLLPFSSKFQAQKNEPLQMIFQASDLDSMWTTWLKTVEINSSRADSGITEYELTSPCSNPLTFEPAYYKISLRISKNKIFVSQVRLYNKKDDSLFSELKLSDLEKVSIGNLQVPSKIESTYYYNGKVFCHQFTTLDSFKVNTVDPDSLTFDPMEYNLRSIHDLDTKTTIQIPQ